MTVLGAFALTFLIVGIVCIITALVLIVDGPLAPVWVSRVFLSGAAVCAGGLVVCCLVGIWSSVS